MKKADFEDVNQIRLIHIHYAPFFPINVQVYPACQNSITTLLFQTIFKQKNKYFLILPSSFF